MLVVPVVAHLATVPVIAGLSGTVSVWAIPANILVAPAVPVVLVVGALGAALAGPCRRVAELCVRVAAPFARVDRRDRALGRLLAVSGGCVAVDRRRHLLLAARAWPRRCCSGSAGPACWPSR